jgi:hypothetical protein
MAAPINLGSGQGVGAGGAIGTPHMGGHEMSVEFAIILALITLGSCCACYAIGYKKGEHDVLKAFAKYVDAQRNEKFFK